MSRDESETVASYRARELQRLDAEIRAALERADLTEALHLSLAWHDIYLPGSATPFEARAAARAREGHAKGRLPLPPPKGRRRRSPPPR